MKNQTLGILFTLCATGLTGETAFKASRTIMACSFEITVIASNQDEANYFIGLAEKEMRRIESLISSWDPNSETSQINRNAGIKEIEVSQELFDLINRCKKISKISDGAFDISFAAMDNIWKFDGKEQELPDQQSILSSIQKVGFEKLILNHEKNSVFLSEVGMKISFGAIGKGYAADQARKVLEELGVKGGIINASGDINAWGRQSNGEAWKVAITNPLDKSTSYGLLPISQGAVVTSGNYEKFLTIDGIRYAHIIDPRTGMPCTGILSATVFAPSAELADALATSVFVMGIDIGLSRIEQIPDVECIIVDEAGNLHHTSNIEIDRS